MKKALLLSLLLCLGLHSAFSQDLILKNNGDEISARIIEIKLQDILYRHPDTLQTDTLQITKSEVFMVRFANGTKVMITQSGPAGEVAQEEPEPPTPAQMYLKGRNDANLYYKGNGAIWTAAGAQIATTALTGNFFIGLAAPVAVGAIPPSRRNFPVSDISLLQDPNYMEGYQRQAHKRKMGKAAIGAGVGTATMALVTAIVVAAFLGSW